jgi:hypothetical protein
MISFSVASYDNSYSSFYLFYLFYFSKEFKLCQKETVKKKFIQIRLLLLTHKTIYLFYLNSEFHFKQIEISKN